MNSHNVEAYLKLLFAIENTNEESERVLACYDTTDNDRLVAIFGSSKELAVLLNTSAKVIDSYVYNKRKVRNKYRLERFIL